MRKLKTLNGAILLGAIFVFAGANSALASDKADRGTVDDPQITDFLAYTSTFGLGGRAAMVLEVDAMIEGIGKATVNIDGSWDFGPALGGTGPYTGDHPCALVDNTGMTLPDFISGNVFAYTATVTITSKTGDMLVGNISGGSVCEIDVFGSAQSINQWLISFEIDGGASTGKFFGESGQGLIDFKFDSQSFSFVQPFQLTLNRN